MYLNSGTLLLQAAGAPGMGFTPFLMVGMFIVMYFFMIRPQAKKAKEQKKFAEGMNVGDHVVTTAGIHGRINKSNDDGTLQLEIGRGTFMTVERHAVSQEMTIAHRKRTETASTGASTPVAAK